jgi:KDO2-lipid IV(A) lauroyltransferase
MVESSPERSVQPLADDHWPVPWQPVWGESNGLGSHLGSLCVRAALWSTARLPAALLGVLVGALAELGARFGRKRTRAAREFVEQALGPLAAAERERLVRCGWRQLLWVTLDGARLARVPRAELGARFHVEISAEARRALEARRGCLLVTGHLGDWEAAFAVLPTLGVHPVYGVAKPPKNRPLSRALQASRERWGVRVLSRKGAMEAAPKVLAAGGTLGLVVDQRTSGRALLVPFFGRLARCERAPAVLLKRQRVPLVFLACRRAPGLTYELELGDVLFPEEWARRPVEEIVLRVNQGLERLIRAHPEQYVWIHERYRDTPRVQDPRAGARLARRGAGAATEPEGAAEDEA